MQDALLRVTPRMHDIKARFQQPDAPVAQLRDEVKHIARSEGFLIVETINSKWMGVHHDNRYGDGVVPTNVHALISDIFGQGFSLKSLQDPTCSEMPPPGHPRNERFTAFNNDLAKGSMGQLPPYDDMLKAVSMTCGHTS